MSSFADKILSAVFLDAEKLGWRGGLWKYLPYKNY